MDALKGHPLEAFDRSIDVHISRIRAVIEDDAKNAQARAHGARRGYVFARKQEDRQLPTAADAMKSLAVPAHLPHGGGGAGAVRAGLGLAGAAPPREERVRLEARCANAPRPGPSCCSARCPPPTRRRPNRWRRCASGRSGCACRWRWTMRRASASPRRDLFRGASRACRPGCCAGCSRAAGRRPHAVGAARPGHQAWRPQRRGLACCRRRTGPPWPPWAGPTAWAWRRCWWCCFIAVAGGAWPVVRRLTRRLEALKQGVEAFGAGALHQRVAEDGRDEVAAVGASFNRAATRIEALLRVAPEPAGQCQP
jgi:HAMP domain-containing protein